MVGYSRLIGLDDAGTIERLRELRRTLIDPAIEQHGGRIWLDTKPGCGAQFFLTLPAAE